MSLQRALTRAFGLMVGLVLLCGVIGVSDVLVVGRSTDELTERVQPLRLATAEMEAAVSEASRGIRGYAATSEPAFLEAFDRGMQRYPEAMNIARGLASAEETALLDEQDRLVRRWLSLYGASLDVAATTVEPSALTEARIRDGKPLVEGFMAANDRLTALLDDRHRSLEQFAGVLFLVLLASMVLVLCAAMAVAVRTGLRITRVAGGSLTALAATVERLSGGDGSARVRLRPDAPHEVRVVAESVNLLADEAERLRLVRAHLAEMRELARIIGLHLRGFVTVEEIAEATVAAIGAALPADSVSVRLLHEGRLAAPVALWADGRLEVGGLPSSVAVTAGLVPTDLSEAYAAGRAIVGPLDGVLGEAAAAQRVPGGTACAVPFGSGDDLYGVLTVVVAATPGWREGTVELVEFIAADLGRSLQHALLHADQRRVIQQLRELDQAKTDFLSAVSHELRTPLTSIAGYAELLSDEELSPSQASMLRVIERNTGRLQSLIEDLLTLSRIDAGAFAVGYAPVPTSKLVDAVAAQLDGMTSGRRLDVDIDAGPEGFVVLGDMEALERMLLGLVSNAVKFTPDGGRIGVQATVTGGHVYLAVSDTGMGIPEAEQQRLFNRFFRASNATVAAIQGTGLGLTITQSIVSLHGGSVAVRSREQAGTTVEVRLPLLRAPGSGMNQGPSSFTDVVTSTLDDAISAA